MKRCAGRAAATRLPLPLLLHEEGERFLRSVRRAGVSLGALLLVTLASCSDLSSNNDEPITLEIRTPAGLPGSSPPVEIGDTFVLSARALNQKGDSVPATIVWRTPDTAFLFVDSLTGRISGKQPLANARVQARTGSLISDLVTFTVLVGPDSLLIVPPDSFRVLTTDTASVPLIAQLDTLAPDGPVAGHQMVFTLTTIFGQPGDTASLSGGVMTRTVLTGSTGQPTVSVYVRTIPSAARPDSVLVDVSAFRPSGAAIPGSGQTFIVRFD